MRFKDKVVIVTGAAQGIGKQIALDFAKEKARVILFDLNEDGLKEAQEELSSYSECSYYPVNITDSGQIEEAINKIIDKFLKIDILA